MITSAAPVSLEDAMLRPHASLVDIVAVIADVSHMEEDILFPKPFRELALIDHNRRIAFLRVYYQAGRENHGEMLTEADVNNDFLVVTKVIVDQCLEAAFLSSITFVSAAFAPLFTSLQVIRHELREPSYLRDQVKRSIRDHMDEIKMLESGEEERNIIRWAEAEVNDED
ncbi:hypothetical protein QOZ80_5BG0436660 [Eleusine coracana subsp. coracana]|nr:hypothetical protein QOZ80_5BG0436660 [Eleusine coracana subsp. coracana]